MPKPKRINAYLAIMQQETEEQTQPAIALSESVGQEAQASSEARVQPSARPQKALEGKIEKQQKKKPRLKQVNMTIGEERELKLDELAFVYTKKKKKRVNRNAIVRYLIDAISLEELLRIDLSHYEK